MAQMKILQINSTDTLGTRFTGVGSRDRLAERGVDSRHLVWRRNSNDPSAEAAFDWPLRRHLAGAINRIENRLSVQSMLHLQWLVLPFNRRFRAADLVHYHIIHDGYFSLAALPLLTRKKPSVWTFHDPWAMTGHCIQPLECSRWQTGCGSCPDLNLTFALRRDRTRLNWRYKQLVYRHTDVDVIVASQWMRDFACKSPLVQGFNFHVVPFGLDLETFSPGPAEAARRRFGILPGHTVIGLRAADGPYKGVEHFKEALRKLQSTRPLCILTTQNKGTFDEFLGRHQIVELGWTNDEMLMVDFYRALDFFVMPSIAEAFGLMAIEAMACGKPVLSFQGTSLPEVTFAPDVGLAVPMRDSAALAAAITSWVDSPDEVRARGLKAREVAEGHYGIDLHVDRLMGVYRDVIARRAHRT